MLDNVAEDDDEELEVRARNNQKVKAAVNNQKSKAEKANKHYVTEKLVDDTKNGGKLIALKILNEKLQEGNAMVLKRRQIEKDNPRIEIEFFKPPINRTRRVKTVEESAQKKLMELVNMRGDEIEEHDKDTRNPNVYMNVFTQEHSDAVMVSKYLNELAGLNARRKPKT